ncbi:WhiB family transcriptional regulator [Actinomadura nitritigenes]|uniref:WhiB family transcriptional regulator n=1 Tax=Actinomadura nitritigenes TaxID=134602 RepID=UPI003D8EC5BE
MTGTAGSVRERAPQSWEDRAVCAEVDPELFFPEHSGWAGALEAEVAKAICAECPVCGDCLATALADPTLYGVWGGTTRAERKQLRRRRRAGQRASRRAAHDEGGRS